MRLLLLLGVSLSEFIFQPHNRQKLWSNTPTAKENTTHTQKHKEAHNDCNKLHGQQTIIRRRSSDFPSLCFVQARQAGMLLMITFNLVQPSQQIIKLGAGTSRRAPMQSSFKGVAHSDCRKLFASP